MSETHTVTAEQMRAAYDALGLDPELFTETKTVTMSPFSVVAVRYRRNEEGQRYIEPEIGDAPKVTTELNVRWSS